MTSCRDANPRGGRGVAAPPPGAGQFYSAPGFDFAARALTRFPEFGAYRL
jgi:hypothetical protein